MSLALAAWARPAAADCTPDAATLSFGTFSTFGAGISATATLTYTCSGISLWPWLSLSTARSMFSTTTSPQSALAFELFQDASHQTPFPTGGVGLTPRRRGSVVVHGLLRPQNVPADAYRSQGLSVTITHLIGPSPSRSFDVSATYLGACTIQPATLAFGSYDPLATSPREATATLSIACAAATRYWVTLGAGNQGAGPGAARNMAGPGGALLEYQLYSDAARTAVWDLTTPVSGTAPDAAAIPLVVYGRIPARQPAPAGGYADVVQATVNF